MLHAEQSAGFLEILEDGDSLLPGPSLGHISLWIRELLHSDLTRSPKDLGCQKEELGAPLRVDLPAPPQVSQV